MLRNKSPESNITILRGVAFQEYRLYYHWDYLILLIEWLFYTPEMHHDFLLLEQSAKSYVR